MLNKTPKKILVIEDDKLLRDLYVELLKSEGYHVEEAGDGEEGFNKAEQGEWDLILLDIMLPKKDGISILMDLKARPPKNANGPIVVLTNLSQDKIIKQCLSCGASYFLIKSTLTPNDVVKEVNTFISEGTKK